MLPSCLTKVQQLRSLREKRHHRFCIQVDGGVNLKTAELAVAAGAEVLVAGSAVFAGGHVTENVEALRKAIHRG
jgi:ribulose-phosphate 3-epimerase